MKKSIAILMVMALVAVAASAQVTVGAWGRGLFVPVSNSGVSGVDSVAENKASWGGAPRIGFTVAGNSDNVGFQADLKADGGDITAGDQQKIWVKPVSMVTIAMGRAQDDTLRGNAAFGSFNWNRDYGAGTGEDVTFSRLSTGSGGSRHYDNKQGVIATVAPIPALFVGLALRDVNGQNGAANNLTENLANNMQIAAGYTIDGVGQIRAQMIRDYNLTEDDTQGEFQVAFKVTAVENLYADVGFGMTTNKDLDAAETKNAALYANYKVAGATVHALVTATMKKDLDTDTTIGLGADYGLEGGLGLSGDVRYTLEANDVTAKTTMFAGITKGFSNGLIGAGVQIRAQDDTGYSIPVRFEYWF